MTTKTKPQGTLWVCQRCLFAREAADEQEPCGCDITHEPWAREPDTDVTHGTDCLASCPGGEACDCSVVPYARNACDGCGCPLMGDRYAYTWWA